MTITNKTPLEGVRSFERPQPKTRCVVFTTSPQKMQPSLRGSYHG